MSTTATRSRSITLTYSPLEAHLAPNTSGIPKHALLAGTVTTVCGKSAEGWKMIRNNTDKPNQFSDVTCALCRKGLKARDRGDTQSKRTEQTPPPPPDQPPQT